MIKMLTDHLLQLLLTIFTKRRLVDKTFISITSGPTNGISAQVTIPFLSIKSYI